MNGPPLILPLSECRDKSLCGAKAVNLGELLRAGLPVPDGFVITTNALSSASPSSMAPIGSLDTPSSSIIPHPSSFFPAVLSAYRALGSPPVAVRSSATAEDLADTSMAGQYETILNIRDESSLLDAVAQCLASLDSPRVRTYLREHGRDPSSVSMAIIVQKLIPADVSGILFCADPRTGSRRHMLIEASWGLGEAIVSGKVQPDIIRLDAETGQVLEERISDKQIFISPETGELRRVDHEVRSQASLRPADVKALWILAQKISNHFGQPQDIEFAIHQGTVYLLQSRPITTLEDGEAFDELLQTTRSQLRHQLSKGQGPWVLHNLAETLPHPTPLSWSIIQRFMSASGGYGNLYRRAGFNPCPTLNDTGFLQRIAGRIYMDLSLAPRMFFPDFPFRYDIDDLPDNPEAAQSPPTIAQGTFLHRLAAQKKILSASQRLREIAVNFDDQLKGTAIPEFIEWCHSQQRIDLASLAAEQLLNLWRDRERNVLDEFAPQSLLPSFIVSMYLSDLKSILAENLWDDDIDSLASTLASGAPNPDQAILMNAALHDLANGRLSADQWIAQFGHRAPAEFDLATPRWRERPPDDLHAFASRLKTSPHPLDLHRARVDKACALLDQTCAGLASREAARLREVIANLHRYLRWREDGKHVLMLGYSLLRDLALEIARRLRIGDDVFQLTFDELSEALRAAAPRPLLAQRIRLYRAESRLTLPHLITADSIDAIGNAPAAPKDRDSSFPAYSLSTGRATGPALILDSPSALSHQHPQSGYILICPSTDTGWTPLFINAAGLIIETGGTLSHGAIVARELNLPAVVLPGATTLFKNSEILSLDADNGLVWRGSPSEPRPIENQKSKFKNPIPPPGHRERFAATARDIAFIFWSAFLLAAFLLPEHWLYQPSLRALDTILWPVIRALGKPAGVAVLSIAMAGLTMFAQRLFTDTRRLREAKRRADNLEREATKLPSGSPQRAKMFNLARPVRFRVAMASFVPLAVLLGPMTMAFFWFPARVDPSVWNSPPGSAVTISAAVDGNAPLSVRLKVPPELELDRSANQSTEPIRTTLESLAGELSSSTDFSNLPWELQQLSPQARQNMLADLRTFLADDIPPQTVAWRVQTPPFRSEKYIVTISTESASPLSIPIIVGDQYPPGPREILADPGSPLQSIKVAYPPPPRRQLFWQPLSYFISKDSSLHYWEAGWLSVYLLAYIPAMFLFRWMLRIP